MQGGAFKYKQKTHVSAVGFQTLSSLSKFYYYALDAPLGTHELIHMLECMTLETCL